MLLGETLFTEYGKKCITKFIIGSEKKREKKFHRTREQGRIEESERKWRCTWTKKRFGSVRSIHQREEEAEFALLAFETVS